jgi:hypothetical protein
MAAETDRMSAPTDEQLDALAVRLMPRLAAIARLNPHLPADVSLGTDGRHEWLSDREGERRLMEAPEQVFWYDGSHK